MLPAELARRTGSTRGAVSHWYSGRSEPTGERLALASEALGVRAKWLATGTGERYATAGAILETLPPASRPVSADDGSHDPARLVAPAEREDDMGDATMDMRREAAELLRAWYALPENERDDFKRRIEVASLRHRRKVPDRDVEHLAAPKAHRPAGKAPGRRRKPTGQGT